MSMTEKRDANGVTRQMPEVLRSFLAYKRTIQNRSVLTVSEYEHDLTLFFRYIIVSRGGGDVMKLENVSIEEIDTDFIASVRTEEVYDFLLYLADSRGNGASARARRLSAVKAFYKYHTLKARTIAENPVKDIDSPNVKQALPKYLTLDEATRLLDSVDKNSRSYQRDLCILTLFLNCGMRLAELVGINLSDIRDDGTRVIINGKGSKQRVIYLNTACRQALGEYLAVRERIIYKNYTVRIRDKDALFLSSRGMRVSRQTVQHIVETQLRAAGLGNRGFSTHKLRHTAATLMYESGNVDVRALKDILGHEQLNTTQIYTHLSDEKLKNAMEANPLAKRKQK